MEKQPGRFRESYPPLICEAQDGAIWWILVVSCMRLLKDLDFIYTEMHRFRNVQKMFV